MVTTPFGELNSVDSGTLWRCVSSYFNLLHTLKVGLELESATLFFTALFFFFHSMEFLTNSFEENPRKAPVPKSFSGNPVFTSVPEVSLVFSPLPSTNVGSMQSGSSNEIIVTNIPSDAKRHFLSSPNNILKNTSSASSVRNVEKIPTNKYIAVPTFKSSTDEAKFLASVGVMADKILEENVPLSRQQRQLNIHQSTASSNHCRGDDVNILMDLQPPNNHRNHPPISHQFFSEIAHTRDSNSPENCVTRRNCYGSSVVRGIEGYPERSNCDVQTEGIFTDKIPLSNCSNLIHIERNGERKSALCAENVPQCIGEKCNFGCKITSYNCLCSINKTRGFCNYLYEKSRPCCCAKLSEQEYPSALQHSNDSNTDKLVSVPLMSFPSKSTVPENIHNVCHCRNSSSDDSCRNVHIISKDGKDVSKDVKMQSDTASIKKTKYNMNQSCISKPTASNGNVESDKIADIDCRLKNIRETNSVRSCLETLEEKCEEELMCDSVKKGKVGERIEENNKNTANTTLLQEIVKINEKQCNFIQGLLQQVVALQADQMRILGQISEKLNSVLTLDENSKKCADVSKICSVKSATTQTNLCESPDLQKELCPQGVDKTHRHDKISKNLEIDRCPCKNSKTDVGSETTTSPVQCEIVTASEKEANQRKKLQDRAVSWSAVHGVETVEESFTLHGVCVPTVVEQMPSSIHTMHLNMQDYQSSASFESIADRSPGSESKFHDSSLDNRGSWTLYNNIVGHVKKFLHTVPGEKSVPNGQQKSSQVEAIRFATIEKIRQLGVSVYENSTEIKEVSTTGRIHFDSEVAHCPPIQYSPLHNSNDASLEIQTLALKYLPEDDLYDIAKVNIGKRNITSKCGQNFVNVSVATQNYLEKYNLLPSCFDDKSEMQIFTNQNPIGTCNNILDITTLKKQPKLL